MISKYNLNPILESQFLYTFYSVTTKSTCISFHTNIHETAVILFRKYEVTWNYHLPIIFLDLLIDITGELGYDGLNGTRKIGPSYAKSVVYIWRILAMHRTGTKHIVRHMQNPSYSGPSYPSSPVPLTLTFTSIVTLKVSQHQPLWITNMRFSPHLLQAIFYHKFSNQRGSGPSSYKWDFHANIDQ